MSSSYPTKDIAFGVSVFGVTGNVGTGLLNHFNENIHCPFAVANELVNVITETLSDFGFINALVEHHSVCSCECCDGEVTYCCIKNGSACAVLDGVGAYIVLIPPAVGEINAECVEVVVCTAGCRAGVGVTSVHIDGMLTAGNFSAYQSRGVFGRNAFDLAVVELFNGCVSFTNCCADSVCFFGVDFNVCGEAYVVGCFTCENESCATEVNVFVAGELGVAIPYFHGVNGGFCCSFSSFGSFSSFCCFGSFCFFVIGRSGGFLYGGICGCGLGCALTGCCFGRGIATACRQTNAEGHGNRESQSQKFFHEFFSFDMIGLFLRTSYVKKSIT